MSTLMTESAPVAGWYEDPLSPSAVRWWNGRGWTEHTQAPAAAVSAPSPGRPSFRESTPAAAAPAATASPQGRNEYVPMRGHADGHDRTSTAAPAARDWLRPTHWSTPGVWAMSFTPWFSVAIAFVLGVLVAVGARWYVLLAAVLLIPLLWIAFAVRDRRRLLELGYDKRPSWAWVLLSPLAYLIARGARVHRVSGRGWAPLWVLLANIALVAGADFGVSMVVQAAVLPQQIHSLESTIASDYATHGVAAKVTCPTSGVSLEPGASFQCTAADPIGRTESIAVRVSAAGRVSYAPATATPGF